MDMDMEVASRLGSCVRACARACVCACVGTDRVGSAARMRARERGVLLRPRLVRGQGAAPGCGRWLVRRTCATVAGGTPHFSPPASIARSCDWRKGSVRRRLRKPGPAISGVSKYSSSLTVATIVAATSRGEDFSLLASDIATLHW